MTHALKEQARIAAEIYAVLTLSSLTRMEMLIVLQQVKEQVVEIPTVDIKPES